MLNYASAQEPALQRDTRRMRLSCSGVKARGNTMPSPRCSNFSARRLLLKEPLPLPSSSPFGLYGYSAIFKRTCYISFYLIVWILKLLPPGVSPPTADMTVSAASAAQRHGAVDAWKCPEKVRLLFITLLFFSSFGLCRVWDWQYVWLEEQD